MFTRRVTRLEEGIIMDEYMPQPLDSSEGAELP
jgi:hypothetical protein